MSPGSQTPSPSDPDAGIWQGREVARRFESPDGMVILVGKTARDNDVLSIQLASPRDFWFHIAADSGSHVVVRNPQNLPRLPRETQRLAASLAVGFSKAKSGGNTPVHVTRCREVSKPRGWPPGKVSLAKHQTVRAKPKRSA